MFRPLQRALVASCLLLATPIAQALDLAVISPRGAADTQQRWTALAEYLGKQVGEPVAILAMSAIELRDAADRGDVDLVLTHSAHTVAIMEQYDGRVLATLDSGAGPRFGGVIVARKDSGITKLEDLKGKNVVSMKFKESAGAYVFQTYELQKVGIDPHKDFGSMKEGKKQDDLVMAVATGEADAAFIRTDLLEKMQKEGKIQTSDFVVVNARKEGDFPYALSTELYAEWCITVMPHVPQDQVSAVKSALLKVSADNPVAVAANIKGFVEPVPMDNIKSALKTLHIAPYDK